MHSCRPFGFPFFLTSEFEKHCTVLFDSMIFCPRGKKKLAVMRQERQNNADAEDQIMNSSRTEIKIPREPMQMQMQQSRNGQHKAERKREKQA